jgi:hypothetical protein
VRTPSSWENAKDTLNLHWRKQIVVDAMGSWKINGNFLRGEH